MFFDGFFDNLDGMIDLDDAPREIFKMYVPDIAAFFGEDPVSTRRNEFSHLLE